MKILTVDNNCFMLNNLPDELDEDVRFSVLDNSDPKEPDFFFIPLIFLHSSLTLCIIVLTPPNVHLVIDKQYQI